MQKAQVLTDCGGVNKCSWKYIGKIDKKNYVIFSVDRKNNGPLVTKATFLHNTKVATYKINKEKNH